MSKILHIASEIWTEIILNKIENETSICKTKNAAHIMVNFSNQVDTNPEALRKREPQLKPRSHSPMAMTLMHFLKY